MPISTIRDHVTFGTLKKHFIIRSALTRTSLRLVVFALSRRRVHASSLIHRSSSDKLIQIILTVLRVRVRHVFEVSRHRRFRVRRLLSVKQTREKASFVLLSHQLID
jgi:hypothetical protein